MKRSIAMGCGLAILAASTGWADNRSRTEGFVLSDGTIEAVPQFSEEALYWCGASEVARTIASGTDRLYVLQGPAPSRARPGKTAVTFSLSPPPGGARSAFTRSVTTLGNNMSVAQAADTCNERSASG